MGRINPLVADFIDKHPVDCARVLEQLMINTTCSLFRSLRPEHAAGIMECMVTSYGSECLHAHDAQTAAAIIKRMKTPQASRLLRSIGFQKAKNILDILPLYLRSNIQSALQYPDLTVGRVMDSNPVSLPESLSIDDAVKRVKKLQGRNIYEIFVVDNDHKLKGVILVADLLSAAKSSSLQTIITSDVPYLSTRATLGSAAVNKAWQTFSTLPVVGKEHILSGVLKSSTLMHVLAENAHINSTPDALDEVFSMATMYWSVMAQLVDTLAGDSTGKKDERV